MSVAPRVSALGILACGLGLALLARPSDLAWHRRAAETILLGRYSAHRLIGALLCLAFGGTLLVLDRASTGRSALVQRRLGQLSTTIQLLIVGTFTLLSFCAQPFGDDFNYVIRTHTMGFLQSQVFLYNGWSGRYFASASLSLWAWVTDLRGYCVGPILLLAVLYFALRIAIGALTHDLIPRRWVAPIALTLMVLYLAGMPDTSGGFYWLTGALCYQGGNIMVLLVVAWVGNVLAKRHRAISSPHALGGCLLAAAAVGSHEVATGVTLGAVIVATLIGFKSRNPSRRSLASVLVIAVLGTAVTALAPGNAARSSHFPGARKLLPSLAASVNAAVVYACWWLSSPALMGATILFVPAAMLIARRLRVADATAAGTALQACLVVLLWVAATVLAFFPGFYGTGMPPPVRALNAIYLFFLIGGFVVECAIVAALSRLIQRPPPIRRPLVCAASVLLVGSLCSQGNFPQAFHDLVMRAWPTVNEIADREAMIRAAVRAHTRMLVVPLLTAPPVAVGITEISADPRDYRNTTLARFWGLDEIRTLPHVESAQEPSPPFAP